MRTLLKVLPFAAYLLCFSPPLAMATMENRLGPEDLHVEILSGDAIRGSGFFVDGALLVTSAHVLPDPTPGAVVILRRPDGGRTSGRVAGVSRRLDLAAIVAPDAFRRSSVRPVRSATAAMAVSAAGSRNGALAVSQGFVSTAVAEIPLYGPGFIAAMPGVGPGFSGGPVVDGTGAVVGMVAAYRQSPRSLAGGRSAFAPVKSAFAPVKASRRPSPFDGLTEAFVIHADVVLQEARRLRDAAPF